MATITDVTYYQKGINFIPNAQDISASDSPSSESKLEYFIKVYERELMLNALGPILYDEFLENIVPPPQRPQKWTDLIEGSTYVLNDNTYIWEGLRGYSKNSLVASYVFCKYLRNDESTYTTTGVVKNTSKNAENVNPTPKYIAAWRQFIEKYQAQTQCNPVIVRDHFGNIGLDYYQNKNSEVSLYQFLTDQNELNAAAFPDFEFTFYENQNSLGI